MNRRKELTQYELETTITFNDAGKKASVFTHNLALIRKMNSFCETRPDLCKVIKVDKEWGCNTYELDKKLIKFQLPRVLSEDTLKKLKQKGKQNIQFLHSNKSRNT